MKTILSLLFAVGFVHSVTAQSYHFSQFYATPLLVNPAYTGNTEEPYRFTSSFRTQWAEGGGSYFTGAVSGDIQLLTSSIPESHKAGIGVLVVNDQSMQGMLVSNSMGLGTAYHVGLDEDSKSSIGIGFQAALHHRRLDPTRLTFENQFGGGGFNRNAPTGETLPAHSRYNVDMNAGILYNADLENKSFFGGIAIYNVLQHKGKFLAEEFRMPARLSIQGGGRINAGDDDKLYFLVTHMRQAKASEVTIGAAYGLRITEIHDNELTMGLWHRLNDAVMPYVGYQMNNFQFGVCYDYTVSSLKTKSNIKNGYEVSFVYKAERKKELVKVKIPWY